MKKRTKRISAVIIVTPIIIFVILYLLLAWYYKDTFSYGTWINGVYSTGKTIEEINIELLDVTECNTFEILLPEGNSQKLSLENIEYKIDYIYPLEQCQKEQNPLAWGVNIFDKDGIFIEPNCTFSQELFLKELESFSFYQKGLQEKEHKISIINTESGYVYLDTRKLILDYEKTIEKINDSLKSGKSYVNLYDNICFYELPMTVEDLETLSLWEKVQEAQEFSTVFIFGEEEEKIDSKIVSNWIAVDEKGTFVLDEQKNLMIDEAKIDEYIHLLAEKYNTKTYPRKHVTIDGREVTISKGNYGNLFDEEMEGNYLKKAYKEKMEDIHTPTYVETALYQGTNDIGPDFIEIDLTNQILYLVLQGVLEVKTEIVTGNVAAGMQTTDRICYIYTKQRNRILRGDGYASQVDYWMPIFRGIGIHDAKWRTLFGGEIYKKNGSHGCINIPREVMEDVYEFSYVGMPVIMYY